MPFKDPTVRRTYHRLWMRRRRQEYVKGQRCAKKGCRVRRRLQLDHIDPKTKESHRIWSWSPKRLKRELKKCQWLCEPHHLEKTAAENRRPIVHGTKTGYTRGCRCGPCRQDAVEKKRSWRKRMALEDG